jgi:hypothetical protein
MHDKNTHNHNFAFQKLFTYEISRPVKKVTS